MNASIKVTALAALFTVSLPTLADTNAVSPHLFDSNWLHSAVAAEVESDGQMFSNQGAENQLRHRVNEQDNDQALKTRNELQNQEKHQNKITNQYEQSWGTQNPGAGNTMSHGMNGGGRMSGGGGGGHR